MPPNHRRSVGAFRMAVMISKGVATDLSMPMAATASGVSVTDFSEREMIIAPPERVERS
ncbi:hypothetical protein D3C80_1120870 [compost metagenome]